MGNACWYTNLDIANAMKNTTLQKLQQVDYKKYDNYKAIEVIKIADIPMDYEGVMGVPITFLDKYNPAQFEIIA